MGDTMTTPRPVEVLNTYSKRYPDAWAQMEWFRAAKGSDLGDWPDWCWVPVAGAYAVVSRGGDIDHALVPDVAVIHALAAWRLSQGIYRFDPEIYEEVASTPLARELPSDLLLRLPEWCVYVEAREPDQPALRGLWACLESDVNDGSRELRMVMDFDGSDPLCLPLHIVPNATLEQCLEDTMEHTAIQAIQHGHAPPSEQVVVDYRETGRQMRSQVARLANLVLYLCADAPDLDRQPMRAEPRKTKRGPRWFPAERPSQIEVGARTARWLREARARVQALPPGEERGPVTPHIRRAHWHGFWSGQLSKPDERRFSLRWLPQIPVGFSMDDLDELVAVVKRVGP
jgi:hypothetical protein